MCLLALLSRVHPDAPLVVAANRDELLARPATALEPLAPGPPRVVGGRDLAAGGTWLAVNEHGLVAALTNRPSPAGRDPRRRSRGELPLLLARHPAARAAAHALAREVASRDYNPCWVLVADLESVFYLEVDDARGPRPSVRELPEGLHVLENRPLDAPSPKVERVRALVAGAAAARGDALVNALWRVLADHEIPPHDDVAAEPPADAIARPAATFAACVHAGAYGTRWSAVVLARVGAPPEITYSGRSACRGAPEGRWRWLPDGGVA